MTIMFNLSNNQKALALNLAMVVECGVVAPKEVVRLFRQDLALAEKITYFWATFNKTTRAALDIVSIELAREHFELCLRHQAEDYPEIEN